MRGALPESMRNEGDTPVPRYSSLDDLLKSNSKTFAKGPNALIFVEDQVEVDTTLRHHINCGFANVIAFAVPSITFPDDTDDIVHRVDHDMTADDAMHTALNAVIETTPGAWTYYCYNAEYLFYPFCETRSVGEMMQFNTEERRNTIMSFVVDLYSDDLKAHPNAVSLDRAHLDRSGYYALARMKPETTWPEERQLDFFGGLRWRYEEHIPEASRRIDRVSLFKAQPGLELQPGHMFNVPEYNTFECEWHHNLTASIMSFRTAKALKRNPGSSFDIYSFTWHNSVPFEWHSRQLLDLGLMEPGQWF